MSTPDNNGSSIERPKGHPQHAPGPSKPFRPPKRPTLLLLTTALLAVGCFVPPTPPQAQHDCQGTLKATQMTPKRSGGYTYSVEVVMADGNTCTFGITRETWYEWTSLLVLADTIHVEGGNLSGVRVQR